ncbi:hypothetical protein FACS1894122_08440 [Alphaproteobacteria bacterium]|nr:hypothetical protein FACS1894122_08440 [Alphaproteobacteria bacterium]
MIADKKYTQKELETKSISELMDLMERSPYAEDVLSSGFLPNIENDIEKAILERIAAAPNIADDIVRYRFVKWKRAYEIAKEKYPELIQIDDLTEYSTGKTNTISDITNNICKEFHKKLLYTKDGEKYVDLLHYDGNSYFDVNDSQFQPGKTVQYFEVQHKGAKELTLLKTKKEYNSAKSRHAHIEKRQYKTKLHTFIAKIITSYESESKDVFDNFEDLKNFITNKIAKENVVTRRKISMSATLAVPSAIGYERAFTPIPPVIKTTEDKAYLRVLSDESLSLLKDEGLEVAIKSIRFGGNIAGRNYPLLNAVYTMVSETAEITSEGDITFFEQDLAERIGKDVRGTRAGTLVGELMHQFDDLIGITYDGSVYKLLGFKSFDPKTGEVKMYVGYFDILRKMMEPPKEIKHRKTKLLHASSHTHLVHADIITKIKNHNAVAIIEFLTVKIQQAGGQLPNGKQRKEISIKPNTIIEAIQQFKATLDEAEHAYYAPRQRKNVILERVFSSVYEGLKEHTELSKYYVDFQIPDRIPTTSTLDTPITFSHGGLNKDFKLPPKK